MFVEFPSLHGNMYFILPIRHKILSSIISWFSLSCFIRTPHACFDNDNVYLFVYCTDFNGIFGKTCNENRRMIFELILIYSICVFDLCPTEFVWKQELYFKKCYIDMRNLTYIQIKYRFKVKKFSYKVSFLKIDLFSF